MRRSLITTAAAAVLALAVTPALADTIDFGQFGPDGTVISSPTTGHTKAGVGFTISGPGQFVERTQPGTYNGQYASGAPVLDDNPGSLVGTPAPGSVTITFDNPIQSITNIAAESDLLGGPYTATLQAFDGGASLGFDSYTDVSANNPGLTQTFLTGFDFSQSSADITSIVITISGTCQEVSCDNLGFGLGPFFTANASVPEPATWALMLAGLGGLGAALRTSRRKLAVA